MVVFGVRFPGPETRGSHNPQGSGGTVRIVRRDNSSPSGDRPARERGKKTGKGREGKRRSAKKATPEGVQEQASREGRWKHADTR